MFTGIIQCTGRLLERESHGDPPHTDARLRIGCRDLPASGLALGDSVAVSGVCLTVTGGDDESFWTDVSAETLACTTIGKLEIGDRLNLETALTPSTPLGGHLVSGHVDGVGTVVSRADDARSVRIEFDAPQSLARYIAFKGSICIDGVSLTVNEVRGARFSVNIVPHTLQITTIGEYRAGRPVNLEVDLVARYLDRLLEARTIPQAPPTAPDRGI